MKETNPAHFYRKLYNEKRRHPLAGQLELTYRCNLNCIHCYCKGSEDREKELATKDWEGIIDIIQKEGCVWLTLTGGDPLIRDDFLEIYSYAKAKGFLINIFTNGQFFTKDIIDYFIKSPPNSIEITLNGITKDTYEAITQKDGSFSRIMQIINRLAKTDLAVILKSNCLKQNRHEIGRIKAFTERVFGKPVKNKYRFQYDNILYPRLNRDKTPCHCRVSFEELLEARRQDLDIWQEYRRCLLGDFPDLERDRNFLYRCNAWMTQFFISPYGKLKFCAFSEKFSTDLKTTPFKEGFYGVFPQILKERFKTNSKCKDCTLRPICYHCPARAYLETGDEEAPVEYFCEIAKIMNKEMLQAKRNNENAIL